MSKEKLYIFDTTLRDGAQTQGVDFSIDEKIKIAEALDILGVDYIEGGWPGANPTDTEFFQKVNKFKNSTLTAFGMTKKVGRSAKNDPGLSALLNTNAPAICLVGKSWDFHVDVALGISKDENLENISGIKAHTIRIWEKRYKLLSPERTNTNIRKYSLESLRKLLNITLLYKKGFKISKIANLEPHNIPLLVREIALENSSENISINALKLSMVNFDVGMFDAKYEALIKNNGFEFVFFKIFVPLMTELGILWQTGAICPSHEHFVTSLIKQKIHIQTEKFQKNKYLTSSPKFVIFLPDNEIHELSILFLNYLILNKGFQTIFLGQSIPIESLKTLLSQKDILHFVTYITVQPSKNDILKFIKSFDENLIKDLDNKLSVFGPMVKYINLEEVPSNIFIHHDHETFVEQFLNQPVFA